MSDVPEPGASAGPAQFEFVHKGLKTDALGMVTSTAVGLASTAPAYSLAATLGFVVAVIGLQTPLLVIVAFIPMFFSAWATKHMNTADPDCGTSFTWAARALGPRTGWFAEVVMLIVMSVVALAKLGNGSAPAGHLTPSWSWFDPTKLASFSTFMEGLLLMVFIYWGWDTTTSINEETEEPGRIPGTAGVISTFLLLGTYLLVVIAVQGFAGIGSHGIGLGNPAHQNDVISVLGGAIFGGSVLGSILSHLLIFMVLTSAAATTQTTILPNARTTLSMAFHKALPAIFGRVHPRYLTPTFSTISFGVVSVIYYVSLNFVSHGAVISDAVTATTFFATLYLGITAAACTWHYRSLISHGFRTAVSYVWVPALGALSLFAVLAYSFKIYWDPEESYFDIKVFGVTIGGTLVVVGITTIVGLVWMLYSERTQREYFSGESMRSGLSLTDNDDIVHIDMDGELPVEHVPPDTHL